MTENTTTSPTSPTSPTSLTSPASPTSRARPREPGESSGSSGSAGTSTVSGALPDTQRSLAPDLARGFMLLVIATVHAHLFRLATSGSFTLEGPLDTVLTLGMALFAENRGYPMFAALFGYGLAQIARRRTADGRPWPWVRRLLRRRGRWLIAIGLAHTLLLFYGDIISVYGLIAVLFAGILSFSDRKLLTFAFGWGAVGTLVYAIVNGGFFDAMAEGGEEQATGPLLDMVFRLATMPVFWPLMLTISVFPVLIGIWAARRQVLEEPARHLPLLRRTAVLGIGGAVLCAIPYALSNIEVIDPSATVQVPLYWLHLVSGYAGGFGYGALIALVAIRIGDRRGPVVNALAATGRRSMTCYLLQSVAWAVLMPSYAFGLSGALTDTQAVGLGITVWLVTVLIADLLRRAGFEQGPAEWLLRRMTYRKRDAGSEVRGT